MDIPTVSNYICTRLSFNEIPFEHNKSTCSKSEYVDIPILNHLIRISDHNSKRNNYQSCILIDADNSYHVTKNIQLYSVKDTDKLVSELIEKYNLYSKTILKLDRIITHTKISHKVISVIDNNILKMILSSMGVTHTDLPKLDLIYLYKELKNANTDTSTE